MHPSLSCFIDSRVVMQIKTKPCAQGTPKGQRGRLRPCHCQFLVVPEALQHLVHKVSTVHTTPLASQNAGSWDQELRAQLSLYNGRLKNVNQELVVWCRGLTGRPGR